MIKAIKTFIILILTMLIIAFIWIVPVSASHLWSPIITVDGIVYEATKVSGPVIHFETPGSNPLVAFTARNTWTGHGLENLPCEFGVHWVDNANVLTISNCLGGDTTTTTTSPSSSTLPPETTTTVPSTTTTTVFTSLTTTTLPATTTTMSETTTSTVEDEPCSWPTCRELTGPTPTELPETGITTNAGLLALAGAWLLVAGILFVMGPRE